MILFGWNTIIWWQGIEPNILNLLYDNLFFGLREICLPGFGWAIFAFDNISGCCTEKIKLMTSQGQTNQA